MVAAEVSKLTGNAHGFSESVQKSTGWLHLAQNRASWRQFSKFWEGRCLGETRCFGTQVCLAWSGLVLLGVCGVEWPRLVSKAGHGLESGRLRETESATDYGENGRRSGSWGGRMVLPEVQNGTLQTWRKLKLKCESFELERERSDSVADFDAPSLGVECWGDWYTRAIHAWKTVLTSQAQKSGRDGWTKAVGERSDGLQLVWYGSDGFDGSDAMVAMASMEWWCRVVMELRWFRSWACKEIGKFLKTSLRMTTTPRVPDGSTSLRRVDKIAGEHVEGLPFKLWRTR